LDVLSPEYSEAVQSFGIVHPGRPDRINPGTPRTVFHPLYDPLNGVFISLKCGFNGSVYTIPDPAADLSGKGFLP
jgi:hypothetical protein